MARKPRLHVPGGVYHVMVRGNGGQDIFFDKGDRSHVYLLLQQGIERYGHRVQGFFWMPNHIHFVMQVLSPCVAMGGRISIFMTRTVTDS